ncbi:GDSL-type esterase/lipase family protein [Streptomyces sp. NBC_00667]|nr:MULTISPECIES: GDSL-type esterase/lipase family protein [unclassified Streptomyces]WUC64501.1 GDSL-type esterase/lipase family protein [Streptomyces sp. NBC_00539]
MPCGYRRWSPLKEAKVADWTTTPVGPHILRGALELERTAHGLLPHRLPGWARRQCPDPYLAMVESQPSGVRLAFRSRTTAVELDVLPTKVAYRGAPAQPDGVYELVVDGRVTARAAAVGGNVLTVDMATGSTVTEPGPVATVRFTGLAAAEKDIEIWLPQAEITELVALRTDAPVGEAAGHGRRVWLHHGSSISHGSRDSGPTGTWPAVAARAGGVELINLGFGGNALLDPFTARAMRDTPADLISVKIGINLVNTDLMRLRAFGPAVHGFLDTLREGHPSVPLLVVSPILCPVQEDTPGPLAPEFEGGTLRFRATGDPAERAAGRLTLNVIRDELARITAARAAQDPHLHYLDGRALYGEPDLAGLPLPDGIHPDATGHRRIGERFAEHAFGAGGPFAAK